MLNKSETELHKALVEDLMIWLRDTLGYSITGVDLEGYDQPKLVENKNVGDGENKIPDLDAFDSREQVYIRGEAKTGNGDLATEHTKTQFRLFADRKNSQNGKASLLYVIVPSSKCDALIRLLGEVGLSNKANVIPVRSGSIK